MQLVQPDGGKPRTLVPSRPHWTRIQPGLGTRCVDCGQELDWRRVWSAPDGLRCAPCAPPEAETP